MLPEKRKNLIITLCAIVIFIIVFISLGALSKYIKSTHKEYVRSSSSYLNTYDYYGITETDEGNHNLYGINKDEEKDLKIRTFYPVLDYKIINDKLVFFSDAVNEVRYDKTAKEYYLYELDSYYSNNYTVKLANNFVVLKGNHDLFFWKYGDDEKNKKEITKEMISDNIFVMNNTVFYSLKDGVHAYDMANASDELIVPAEASLSLDIYPGTDHYFYLFIDNHFFVYSFEEKRCLSVSDELSESNIKVMGIVGKKIAYIDQNDLGKLKFYSLEIFTFLKDYIDLQNNEILIFKALDNEEMFLEAKDEYGNITSGIINAETKEVVQSFENNYTQIIKVGK